MKIPGPHWLHHAIITGIVGLVTGIPWLGAAFYTPRELNQYFQIVTIPERLVWLLGRPSDRFDWPGFLTPFVAVLVLYLAV